MTNPSGHNLALFDCCEYMDETDEALLLSGDLEDFGRFYDRYVRSLLAFFQRRTRDPEVAADLTAETFAAALVARARYEPRTAAAAAWLFAIAHHKLTDYRRRGSAEDRMRARLGMEPRPGRRRGRGDDPLARRGGRDADGRGAARRTSATRSARTCSRTGTTPRSRAAEQLSEATVRKRVSRGLGCCATAPEGTDEQRLHPEAARRAAARRARPQPARASPAASGAALRPLAAACGRRARRRGRGRS